MISDLYVLPRKKKTHKKAKKNEKKEKLANGRFQ
jgi:hypothetical protein